MLSELDRFLVEMLPRQLAAEQALCHGDAEARSGTWSQREPVTLFGAAVRLRHGWPEVRDTFRWLADLFSDLHDYQFELVAAGTSGDLAYTVGFEHRPSSPTARPRPTRFGSRTSTAARTANGASSIATAITHQRSRGTSIPLVPNSTTDDGQERTVRSRAQAADL